VRTTRATLSRETAGWLATLPERLLVDGKIALVHGGVRDVQLYMRTSQIVAANAALLRADFPGTRVCFFGHSHFQKVYEVDDAGSAMELPLNNGLARERLYFINMGSVDAQRKNSARLAECAIFDTGAWAIEFLAVRYDAASTEAKAAAGGYRITPLLDRIYTWRRRRLPAAPQRAFSRQSKSA